MKDSTISAVLDVCAWILLAVYTAISIWRYVDGQAIEIEPRIGLVVFAVMCSLTMRDCRRWRRLYDRRARLCEPLKQQLRERGEP